MKRWSKKKIIELIQNDIEVDYIHVHSSTRRNGDEPEEGYLLQVGKENRNASLWFHSLQYFARAWKPIIKPRITKQLNLNPKQYGRIL